MSTIIELDNVTKIIKNDKILDKVSFKVDKGSICGIVGQNGSGKSVIFKHMVGLMLPTDGKVVVNGVETSKGNFPPNVGIILDCTGFLPMYTAFDNLKLIASINEIASDEDISDWLKKIGLDSDSKKKVKNFSKGMKQRLAIAQALMEKPELLLLDEPMEALDHEGVDMVRKLLLDLNSEGVTIVITSHIKEDIDMLCKEVYMIDRGVLTKKNMDEL